MNYLARLKQLEAGEMLHHAPKPEPTKPTEPHFDGFVGSIPGANENIYTVCVEVETTSFRWLVHFADREPVEVFTHPDACHARMMREYPDAVAAEPLPEPPKPVMDCATCTNSRRPGGVARYCCARPNLPPAYGGGHPLRLLPDDGGVSCGQWGSRT